MFWGITLENGKRYTQKVENSFHVSMAALEKSDGKKNAVSIMVEHKKSDFLLCTLNHGDSVQQHLDLNFDQGEDVTFFTNGEGTVHLTGYINDEFGGFDSEMESGLEDEESSSEDEETQPKGNKRKLPESKTNESNKKRMTAAELMRMDDSDDSEDDDESEDPSFGSAKKFKPQQKTPAKPQQKTPARPQQNEAKQITPGSGGMSKKARRAEKRRLQKMQKEGGGDGSAASTAAVKSILEKNKPGATPMNKNVLNGGDSDDEVKTMSITPEGASSKKKRRKNKKNVLNSTLPQSPNSSAGTPAANKPNFPTPKSEARKLPGGTQVEDIVQGNGPVAKRGRFVHISYVGKLTNNKVFDSSKKDPLGFRLGSGEVIKGMDIGVEGMKVGGKRKITIPSHQAYGREAKSGIPANSTLIFDIELKAVK